MSFASIPLRDYGLTTPDWWNALRAEGIALENIVAASIPSSVDFTLANNQVAAADVTGLTFDENTVRGAVLEVLVRRKITTGERVAMGRITVAYREYLDTWDLVDGGALNGDETGVTFSITASGQVQYTTDNFPGSGYSGLMKYKIITTFGV